VPTDPRGLRGDALLLDAWLRFQEEAPTPFTIPGHKHRRDLVGDVIAGDVPLYAGLDTMKLSRGVLADAEARAARLWGADVCRFSVGGATHANQALALALAEGGDGGRVVVGRTLHRSMLLGLVLAGLTPVWVRPDIDPATGLPAGVPPSAVADALASAPDARAVLVADPSYVGTVGDVAGLAEVAHAHDVPLVVDAAWAAHFGFHPSLPRHALEQGADAMVVSAHKTLPSWSQAALVLARTDRIDPARLDAGVEATQTTSPAGAILASIDAARALLERDGASLLDEAIAAVAAARDRLREVEGLVVLDGPRVDPLKLTLVLGGTGADGIAVENDLLVAGLPVEAAERDTIVAQVSMADDAVSLGRLTEALVRSLARHRGSPRPVVTGAAYVVEPVTVMSPRAAFFAPSEAVPIGQAVGRVTVELVAPYPPGIPILAPGEEVTAAALDAVAQARAAGVRIAYAADPTLATLRVVR
jgi:lysine decarboxylase